VASETHFQLFGLPARFALDADALEKTWRALAAQVHPDRYATATAAERRVAMQWASAVNEAYRVLKAPLSRARYLCELSGCDVQSESSVRMDNSFLMLQIDLREQLDDARASASPDALRALADDVAAMQASLQAEVAELIDHHQNYERACGKVREWMFIEKLVHEIQTSLAELTDTPH